MNNSATIIVVEDEAQIRRFLRTTLVSEGYQVVEAETGKQGLAEAATRKPDLVILDLGLPDMDGVEVVRGIRAWSSVPVIILSARSQESDKISALDAGADDYLVKPFGVGELLARIRVALRHVTSISTGVEEGVFSVDELKVDMVHRKVTVSGAEVHLTPTRIPSADRVSQARGQGADAPVAAQGSLGAELRGASSLSAYLYGYPAPQTGERSCATAFPADGKRRGLQTGCGLNAHLAFIKPIQNDADIL